MENIKEGFMEDLRGYAEEYPDWKHELICAALIGLGLGFLIALLTVTLTA
ncbi:MAG: hypothetical protein PUC87_06850 [Galactobacillus timonensis]|jgi:hypothetical protein|nr:hypothetical protein [Galactobacillus timonensis]